MLYFFTLVIVMKVILISLIIVASNISLALSQEVGEVTKISFTQLEKEIAKPSDKIKIINFWATWCKPCVAEMPHFEEVSLINKGDVELYFVSLDFPEELNKVKSFQQKKKLSAEIILLDETNYDYFMPKISKEWTGAIPATLFVDTEGNRYFYEQPFSKKELSEVVLGFIN